MATLPLQNEFNVYQSAEPGLKPPPGSSALKKVSTVF